MQHILLVIGASLSEPDTCDKTKNCLFMFIYIYIWYVRILYMHSALFVRDAIFPHSIHVASKDIAKLATFESQYVRLTYGIQRKKERKAKA